MNCTNCGREVVAQAKFCSYCGERLAIPCPTCETLNAPDALFCHNCGVTLADDQQSSTLGPTEVAQPEAERPRCLRCGAINEPASTHCYHCNSLLGSPGEAAAQASRHAPQCPRCNATNEPASTYCFQCGLPLDDSVSRGEPSLTGAVRQYTVDYNIPLWRVLIMSVLSAGLYIFYWFYLTWKHYRDSNYDEAYPVWHALTLLVPIYGLFRTHAHMRTYKELMTWKGMVTTVSPGWAVAAMLATNILSFFAGYPDPVVTQAEANFTAASLVMSVAIVVWLLLHVQSNLNRYWSHSYGRVTSMGFSILELAIVVLGLFIWLDIIATVVSDSYRLGL